METKTANLIVVVSDSEGNRINHLSYTHKNVSNLLIGAVIDEVKSWLDAMNDAGKIDPDAHATFEWTVDSNNFVLDSWNSSW
jgi:hypothetical protein